MSLPASKFSTTTKKIDTLPFFDKPIVGKVMKYAQEPMLSADGPLAFNDGLSVISNDDSTLNSAFDEDEVQLNGSAAIFDLDPWAPLLPNKPRNAASDFCFSFANRDGTGDSSSTVMDPSNEKRRRKRKPAAKKTMKPLPDDFKPTKYTVLCGKKKECHDHIGK